jgi:glycosyltransferase involved in cell wall biosynthesis
MDFVVQTSQPGLFDQQVRELGALIHVCPVTPNPWAFHTRFRTLLRNSGPYDAVHSHVHHFSGYVLRIAAGENIRTRIAHCHSDTRVKERAEGLARKVYLRLTARMVQRYATLGFACSRPAAADLFGPAWESDRRWHVLYCGIDLAPFQRPADPAMRLALGIPATALVIGHVGRFVPSKNHFHLLSVMADLLRVRPASYLVLVGSGPLQSDVTRALHRLGIHDRVLLLGDRPDVPQLMMSVMDVFVLPSYFEGLGLVALEAQAAGLPCILADTIPADVDVSPQLIHRLPLTSPTADWVNAILHAPRATQRPAAAAHALAALAAGPFNIANSVSRLTSFYDSALSR